MEKSTSANDTRNYVILIIGIIIGLIGIFFRFFGDTIFFSIVANVFFIGGIVVCLRSVFAILK